MKLSELKNKIQQYQYFEDTNIIDVSLASIIATRLKLGDPVWLIIIGPSSGGKSQILRPLSITDPKFLHRVDDLTENTFLSGGNGGKGDVSLLTRIGPKGILVISDLTVIFSKNAESRASILSQFRMIYDGEMTKFVGNKSEPLTWKGSLGVIAGSTPSVYSNFEEVADMGERFIYWRMKDYDSHKSTRLALGRKIFGKQIDEELADKYDAYIKDVVLGADTENINMPEDIQERITKIATLSEKIRTTTHTDRYTKQMDRLPVAAMPMRVALQLITIAKALLIMRRHEGQETLNDNDMSIIEWCAFSLANEEKRACLRILATLPHDQSMSTQLVADEVGLSTDVIGVILQNMSATGVLRRSGGNGNSLLWRIKDNNDREIIRKIHGINDDIVYEEREVTGEEGEESRKSLDRQLENF